MFRNRTLWALWGIFVLASATLFGQDAPPAEAAKPAAGPTTRDELALKQGQLADKYTRLEDLLFKLSALEAGTNPRRAALLQRAVQQSKEKLTKSQAESVVRLLQQNQLKRAVDGQSAVQTDLRALLDLLMSEDRSDRLKGEQQRIKEYIKEVERLIRLERSLQGQTEGETDTKKLAQEQGNIAGRTGDLAQKIKDSEEGGAKSGDSDTKDPQTPGSQDKPKNDKEGRPSEDRPMSKDGDSPDGSKDGGKDDKNPDGTPKEGSPSGKPGEPKPGDPKPGDDSKSPMPGDPKDMNPEDVKKPDGQPKPPGDKPKPNSTEPKGPEEAKPGENGDKTEPSDSEGKPSEGKPQSGKSMPGQPQQGKPQDGGQGDSSPEQQQQQQQNDNPARKRLEQAQQSMKDAQKKLEEAKRKESLAEQQKAREELEKAKAELEQILRQLREEEIERTLAMLEARFRKMLEMQLKVYESTRRLDQITEANRTNDIVVQAGKLSFDERKIALEAQKALTLLTEEGSSVAFPASVEQIHTDMEQIVGRLADAKVDDITLGVEEDVIAALEEMIEALQQAQQDMEKKRQQQQQQQQQQQGEQEQALVDKIAELKMIRALQERVNKRTNRYARLLQDDQDLIGQAETADLVEALQKLGGTQQEIQRITRDIVVGKNK